MVQVPGDQSKLTDCPVWLLVGESGLDGTGAGKKVTAQLKATTRIQK